MAKQGTLPWYATRCAALEKRVAELSIELNIIKAYTIQQAVDVAQITLHQMAGFGQSRNIQFENEYRQNWAEVMRMALDEEQDEKSDDKHAEPTLAYTVTTFDKALADALGGSCMPYEDRYSLARIVRRAADMSVRFNKSILTGVDGWREEDWEKPDGM